MPMAIYCHSLDEVQLAFSLNALRGHYSFLINYWWKCLFNVDDYLWGTAGNYVTISTKQTMRQTSWTKEGWLHQHALCWYTVETLPECIGEPIALWNIPITIEKEFAELYKQCLWNIQSMYLTIFWSGKLEPLIRDSSVRLSVRPSQVSGWC